MNKMLDTDLPLKDGHKTAIFQLQNSHLQQYEKSKTHDKCWNQMINISDFYVYFFYCHWRVFLLWPQYCLLFLSFYICTVLSDPFFLFHNSLLLVFDHIFSAMLLLTNKGSHLQYWMTAHSSVLPTWSLWLLPGWSTSYSCWQSLKYKLVSSITTISNILKYFAYKII